MSVKNQVRTSASKEIEKQRHLDKIRLLEEELSRLTILENPREIKNICNSIIDLKNKLEKSS
jgi:hypothetical protein